MASKIVVHLRGLPWDATDASIGEFLEITPEQVSAIKICTNEAGKPSGEGYVVVTDAQFGKAFQKVGGSFSKKKNGFEN